MCFYTNATLCWSLQLCDLVCNQEVFYLWLCSCSRLITVKCHITNKYRSKNQYGIHDTNDLLISAFKLFLFEGDLFAHLLSSIWALGERGKRSKAEKVDPTIEGSHKRKLFFYSGGAILLVEVSLFIYEATHSLHFSVNLSVRLVSFQFLILWVHTIFHNPLCQAFSSNSNSVLGLSLTSQILQSTD